MQRFSFLILLFLMGCGGIYGSNVGDPNSGEKLHFMQALNRVRVGMPEDSLTILFGDADQAGDAGILLRSEVNFGSVQRTTYQLGWKSEPRHQGTFKRPEEIDQLQAIVELRHGFVSRIQRVSGDK